MSDTPTQGSREEPQTVVMERPPQTQEAAGTAEPEATQPEEWVVDGSLDFSKVAVGIVGYNDPPMLAACLDQVFATIPEGMRVYVYDDGSWAANVKMLQARPEMGTRLVVFASDGNLGAAYGRNTIWSQARADGFPLVATLDMDIHVQEGWLHELVGIQRANADCGIATFTYCNDHGGRFPVDKRGRVAETASMCWLVDTEALDACLGPDHVWGMDRRLALLCHDSELCQRMKRCSIYRTYVSSGPLISELEHSHSTKTGCELIDNAVHARRDLDNKVWGQLERARGWDKDKERIDNDGAPKLAWSESDEGGMVVQADAAEEIIRRANLALANLPAAEPPPEPKPFGKEDRARLDGIAAGLESVPLETVWRVAKAEGLLDGLTFEPTRGHVRVLLCLADQEGTLDDFMFALGGAAMEETKAKVAAAPKLNGGFVEIDENVMDGDAQTCRVCGCTDTSACVGDDGLPCHWVADDLCSKCSDKEDAQAKLAAEPKAQAADPPAAEPPLHITIINADTTFGPEDPDRMCSGSAQLFPEYLARALARRGHKVCRVSPYPGYGMDQETDVMYVPIGMRIPEPPIDDLVIAMRDPALLNLVDAGDALRTVWLHDAHRFDNFGLGACLEANERLVAVSDHHARLLASRYDLPREALHIIPCAAPAELLDIPIAHGRTCYTCGQWSPCRGTVEAIQAVDAAWELSDRQLELVMLGDHRLWGGKPDDYYDLVEEALDDVEYIHGHISRLGTIPHTQMLNAYRDLSIFVHPATAELGWTSGIEAAMAGKPIVAALDAANALPGIETMSVHPGSIAKLCNDPDWYIQIAEANRAWARDFTWDKCAERWERMVRR